MPKTFLIHGDAGIAKPDGRSLTVMAIEETVVGFRFGVDGACRTGLPRFRVLATAVADADGRFSAECEPSEAPSDACDWQASVRVDVFDGSELVWRSPARPVQPVLEFRQDGPLAATAAAVSRSTVHGHLTVCGRPAAGLDVVVTEKSTVGVDQPGEPCIPHSRTREVGHTVTDGTGGFAVTFAPTPDVDHCSFPSFVVVRAVDGDATVWESPRRLIGPDVTVNGDLFPDCPAGASVVRVFDDRGFRVAGADVYADGVRVGGTDAIGQLLVFPPLVGGQLLAARELVHEQPTDRQQHADGAIHNWAYRVYITSVPVRYDENGDAVRLPLVAVDDPGQPIDLRIARRNALVGLNLTVSIEWDASETERARFTDRLVETSELIYNATDGQFSIERLHVSESAGRWDTADIRIYANLNQPSNARVSGILGAEGVVRLNPNDSHYAGTILHELGHYALGVRDEYEGDGWDPANGPVRCTLQSTDDAGPFSDGGGKDSCFMRGSRDRNKKKLCSAHPDNPHVAGTDQGAQDCWSDVVGRYRDLASARWRLLSPTTRGVIVDRLPDSGVPVRRSTQPPAGGDRQVPSFIPVAGWKPRVQPVIDHRGALVEGVVVRTEFNGVPVRRQKVWLHSHVTGRKQLQGMTKDNYDLAYGLSTGDGEIPLRGAHVDDEVTVLGAAPGGGVLLGKSTVTRADPHTVVIPLRRFPFPFFTTVEPRGAGLIELDFRVADQAPRVAGAEVYVAAEEAQPDAPSYARVRPAVGSSVVSGLPDDGRAVVAVVGVTLDGNDFADERGLVSSTVDDEPTSVWSSDGRLKLRLLPRTFDTAHQVLIEAPGVDSPTDTPFGEVVSGPYRVSTSSPDERWYHDAALLFFLPSAEVPEHHRADWVGSLVVAELDPRSGEWQQRRAGASADPAVVSTRIDHGGTYVLARRA